MGLIIWPTFAIIYVYFSIVIMNNICVYRHLQLRITAIRETFEEVGLLICSRKRKEQKTGLWADIIEDIDVNYWQSRVSLLSMLGFVWLTVVSILIYCRLNMFQ